MIQHEELTFNIRAAATEVHIGLGPGLLESAYEECLCYELSQRNLAFERQLTLPESYKNLKLNCGYRLDLVVEKTCVVELKAVAGISKVFKAQLLTYMKLGQFPVGLLINFNVPLLKDGIVRLVL
ncbi:GxxExxY protein [Fuerstiella marisgermanici]|uniref:GxxExxY protein n=1 Tax=Fuerstiella marisgermanici TaxID=1891926 RepID=A0A1P8WI50_9PLAN|nr:GxxExxY protein [Fuerstiella marisgermanici]APZ93739.1 GxxExxY protein [Fuerstiella marisgermanici]